ncbi:MAG: nicotinamide-nucleotide amidohydrolase family protein [Thermotogae bacterium]|nr:nicotinamide-nucleotide amidohydrolase family protein [Thermotogota bacterium]
MKSWIVTTGNEILDGVVKNTDAEYLTKRLNELGFTVMGIQVVRDELEAIERAVRLGLDSADIVIISGGLGSTDDDITREAVASLLGRKLYIDRPFADKVFDRYKRKFGARVPRSVEKFALMIEGAKTYFGDEALVPAQVIETEGKLLVLLPGPPSELIPLFEKVFNEHPTFSQHTNAYAQRTFKFANVPESVVEESLRDVLKDVEYSTTLDYFVGPTIRIKVKQNRADQLERIEEVIHERFPEDFFGTDETSLEEVTVKLLEKRGLTLSIAESCTGGNVSAILVKVSGLSRVYKGAVVGYNRKVKETLLHVSQSTIDKHDVVSELVAAEMAENVRKILQSDIGASVTGVAGPDRGDSRKEVGTVCFAISDSHGCRTFTENIRGDRRTVVQRASYRLLDLIRRHMLLTEGG